MVEESTPSATTVPDPEIVEFAATGPELMLVNSTVPPVFTKGVAIESVLVSGVVDRRVQVEIPIRLLGLQAPYVLLLPVFVAVKEGVYPEDGLLLTSLSEMVIVDALTPSAATGEVPIIELLIATGAAPMKTALPPATETGVRS